MKWRLGGTDFARITSIFGISVLKLTKSSWFHKFPSRVTNPPFLAWSISADCKPTLLILRYCFRSDAKLLMVFQLLVFDQNEMLFLHLIFGLPRPLLPSFIF